MKRFLVCLSLAMLLGWSVPARADGVNPDNVQIQVKVVAPSRILPHAFYDQAIASIPGVYPESEILDGARFRQLGSIAYAYVAYRTAKDARTVRLELLATDAQHAWHLAAEPPLEDLETQRKEILREVQRLASGQPATADCRELSLPVSTTELPSESPPAGPYERLSVYTTDLDLGLGHIEPADDAFATWDWYRRATFPLFAAPGGKSSGWVANGWRIDTTGRRTALGTAGMLETGYETPSFLVLQEGADGWLQIRLAPPGAPDSLAWVHPCHLAQAPLPLRFERWDMLFRRVEVPLYFRRAIPHNLRAAPNPTAAILHLIPARDHRYQLELLDVEGDWMQVRVTEPPTFCSEDKQPRATYTGWIQWRDDRVGPWLWYPTRGC